MLDLSKFDLQAEADRGATMQVLHPKTGNPIEGASCRVVGTDAKAYRDKLRRLRDAAMSAPEREPQDEDTQLLLGRARTAVAALTGWDGIADGGDPLPFDDETGLKMLVRYPWLADQVIAFANARGNFGKD